MTLCSLNSPRIHDPPRHREAHRPVAMSDETTIYLEYARLFSLWATKLCQEWFCDTVAFTTAAILQTQDACVDGGGNTVGVTMLVDTDRHPEGAFYSSDVYDSTSQHQSIFMHPKLGRYCLSQMKGIFPRLMMTIEYSLDSAPLGTGGPRLEANGTRR